MNDWPMVLVVVSYAVIGAFIVTDAWFDFKISARIRKMFGKSK